MNTNGIIAWAAENIIPLLLLVIGLGIILSARKGRYSDNFATVGLMLLGLIVIFGAAGFAKWGEELAGIAFGA